ncbi:6558_t:CDS:2 [Paraglomus occultum]|uniref:6558_t:CDS:1 n=1 Tax=Paraglomus occultum TaxID=144539 RepID=A0A9N8YWP6_9GLOM|nr:6558_t:CDS:2 [Paraglomus occultum]
MQKSSSSLSSTTTSIPVLPIPPSYNSNNVTVREHSRTDADNSTNSRNTLSTECSRYIEAENMNVISLDIESGLNQDASTRNQETLKICRLCHKNSNSSETQSAHDTHNSFLSHLVSPSLSSSTLISPCKCRTSHHYVHIGCLEQWQDTQSSLRNSPVSFSCEKCGFEYRLYRLQLAKIILHWTSKQFYTTLLLLLAALLASFIAHFVITFLISNGMYDPSFLSLDKPTTVFSLSPLDFIGGLCIISLIGIVYLALHSSSPLVLFSCIPLTCCAMSGQSDGIGCNECANGNADCGIVVITAGLMLLASLIVYGFFGAVFGTYILINRAVEWVMELMSGWIIEIGK